MKRFLLFMALISCMTVNARSGKGVQCISLNMEYGQNSVNGYEPVPDGYVRVRGWVTSSENNGPVSNCTMSLEIVYCNYSNSFSGGTLTQSTDSNGYFCFYIPKLPLYTVFHVLYLGGVSVDLFDTHSNGDYTDWIYNIRI